MWVVLALIGCGGGGRCDAGALGLGGAAAVVEGSDWSADGVTWSWAGSALQINSTASGGWLLSLVAQTDLGGDPLEAAAGRGDYPIEVDLLDGGYAVMYPDQGGSYASNKGGGGSLEILEIGADEALGCFSFDAASADGEALTVSAGAFRAALF